MMAAEDAQLLSAQPCAAFAASPAASLSTRRAKSLTAALAKFVSAEDAKARGWHDDGARRDVDVKAAFTMRSKAARFAYLCRDRRDFIAAGASCVLMLVVHAAPQ
jgi:hypothetical protein